MPYDLRIICGRDFVRLDAEGSFDMIATRRLLLDAIWACTESNLGNVLIDIRDATADFSTAQLVALADTCQQVSVTPDEHRIAILTGHEERLDRASFVANLTKHKGWNIEAFSDFERAFEWLISGDFGCGTGH